MMPVVRLPDELFQRLQKHAEPLVDTPADVISRVLEGYERALAGAATGAAASVRPAPDRDVADAVYRDHASLWAAQVEEFNRLSPRVQATKRGKSHFKQIKVGQEEVHYEWTVRSREHRLDVCLHFESSDRDENIRRLNVLTRQEKMIREGIELEYSADAWGRRWAQLMFRVPYSGLYPDHAAVVRAAEVMKTLMDRTIDLLDDLDDDDVD